MVEHSLDLLLRERSKEFGKLRAAISAMTLEGFVEFPFKLEPIYC